MPAPGWAPALTPVYDALVLEYRHALRATPGDRTDEADKAAPAAPENGYLPPALARWQRARRPGTGIPMPRDARQPPRSL